MKTESGLFDRAVLSEDLQAALPPVPSRDDPYYWRLMYERREAEAHFLSEQIVRIQRDTARLDWLEANKETVYLCTHQERVASTMAFRHYETRLVIDGWAVRPDDEASPTPRAAIDAAMRVEPVVGLSTESEVK